MSLRLLLKKDVLLVVLAKAVNGITTLGLNLYAVHFLQPADFGALTICTTMLVLMDGMIGAALDLAVVKLEPLSHLEPSGSPVEQAAMGLKSVACLLFGGCLLVLSGPIGRLLLHRSDARPLFAAWTAATIGVLLLRSVQLSLQLRTRYLAFACIEFLNTTLRIGLVFALVSQGHASSTGVVSAYAAATAVALMAGLLTLMRVSGIHRWWGLRGTMQVLRAGATALSTYGFSAVVSRLDVFVLAALVSPAQLGIYTSAFTMAMIPEIAATYAAPAFLPRIRPYCEMGLFQQFFTRLHFALLAVAVVGYGLMLWWLPVVGPRLLPQKYWPAIPITLVLLPGMLATMSLFPVSLNLLMLRNSRVFLYYDLALVIPLVCGYVVSSSHGLFAVACVTTAFRLLKTLIVQIRASGAAREAQGEWLLVPGDRMAAAETDLA